MSTNPDRHVARPESHDPRIARIHVDLLPRQRYEDVVVLIDVLRTCTVVPVLFERRIEEVVLTPSLRAARAGAAASGHLLLGERQGLPPEGFNYGNSPAELVHVDFAGRSAVMVSENAPASLDRFEGARYVLLGSIFNAAATVRAAAELANERIDLVCCGFRGEEDLDDALGAGFLAADLGSRFPEARLTGAANFSMSLLRAFPDPLEALWQSVTGHYLRRLELEQDIGVAALVSRSEVVPVLRDVREEHGSRFYRFTPLERA